MIQTQTSESYEKNQKEAIKAIKKNKESFLKKCRIINDNEDLEAMTERVFSTVSCTGDIFQDNDAETLKKELSTLFLEGYIVPSTPILTNAGRHNDKPLSACSVPNIDKKMSRKELQKIVNDYHIKGMGTGFNFDDSDNPLQDLLFFNEIAVEEDKRKVLDRPVGNMGILSIDHPQVIVFAKSKSNGYRNLDWKFNISINLKKPFMKAVKLGGSYCQKDGTVVNARKLLQEIVSCAHDCGDPGLVFLDRFEETNATPHIGQYLSIAPCGEISMASGETCQFSYINVGKLVSDDKIDYEKLKKVVFATVKMLDNSLEISKKNIAYDSSAEIIDRKRKIGVGICGFSDMLIKLGLAYDSEEANSLAKDLISFINYHSKSASVDLAKKRGAFPAWTDSETKRELIIGRYLGSETRTVSKENWAKLNQDMQRYGIRNVSTVALPPTGRSSMIIDASPSIEPLFRLMINNDFKRTFEINAMRFGYTGNIEKIYSEIESSRSCQRTDLPPEMKAIYKTCIEISPDAHLNMVASFQKYTDDSIAKTVNLPNDCKVQDVERIYLRAYDLGLKGITVYRDGCKNEQPMELNKR